MGKNKPTNKSPYIPEIAKGQIPFNSWSRERIQQNRKRCTSRKKIYLYDSRVEKYFRLRWGFIKHYLYQPEGAESPQELQKVINKIFRREVKDHEEFIVHFGDFTKKGVILE